MRSVGHALRFIWLGLACALLSIGPAAAQADNRPMLMFSVNQGFVNGPVENGDAAAFGRMLASLKPFESRYRVYALFSVWHSNMGQIEKMLDMARAANVPFMVDVYSSDALTIPAPGAGLADLSHGIPLSLSDLRQLRRRYGAAFAGVRSHEVLGEDYTVDACRQKHVSWCDAFKAKLPPGPFFEPQKMEAFFQFAARNNMFVLFSEPYWSFHHQDPAQPGREKILAGLLRKYPGRVIVTYANNEPNESSQQVIGTWPQGLAPFVADGALGIGLSDQAWFCPPPVLKCPVSHLVEWARSALAAHATAIETEPYWYWWNLPAGRQSNNYAQFGPEQSRGQPLGNLTCFAAALGVSTAGFKAPCPG